MLKEKKGVLGEVIIYTDTEGHSVIRVGTPEMELAVKNILTNDKGVLVEKVGGPNKKVCLCELEKEYSVSICQIAEDIWRDEQLLPTEREDKEETDEEKIH